VWPSCALASNVSGAFGLGLLVAGVVVGIAAVRLSRSGQAPQVCVRILLVLCAASTVGTIIVRFYVPEGMAFNNPTDASVSMVTLGQCVSVMLVVVTIAAATAALSNQDFLRQRSSVRLRRPTTIPTPE
jgi:hypothetical protein